MSDTCMACEGSGYYPATMRCSACGGTGYYPASERPDGDSIDDGTSAIGRGPLVFDVKMARERGWSASEIKNFWNAVNEIVKGYLSQQQSEPGTMIKPTYISQWQSNEPRSKPYKHGEEVLNTREWQIYRQGVKDGKNFERHGLLSKVVHMDFLSKGQRFSLFNWIETNLPPLD